MRVFIRAAVLSVSVAMAGCAADGSADLGRIAQEAEAVLGSGASGSLSNADIVKGLKAKDQLLIFPEGTTTDGKVVGRIYPRLLGAAITAEAPIQPIVIHYTDTNSDASQSELVPYIGDQNLVSNLWGMLGCEHLNAHVHFLPPVETTGMARKELVNILQTQMQLTLQKSQANPALSH